MDLHPFRTGFDLACVFEFPQKTYEAVSVLPLPSGFRRFLTLSFVVECPLERLDVVFECRENIGLAQRFKLFVRSKAIIGLNDRMSFGPPCIRLQIESLENAHKIIHG